jgi:hypothetical protein
MTWAYALKVRDLSLFSRSRATEQQLLPGRINGIYDRDDKMLLASIFISRFFMYPVSFLFYTTFISNLNHMSWLCNTRCHWIRETAGLLRIMAVAQTRSPSFPVAHVLEAICERRKEE